MLKQTSILNQIEDLEKELYEIQDLLNDTTIASKIDMQKISSSVSNFPFHIFAKLEDMNSSIKLFLRQVILALSTENEIYHYHYHLL